jgi:hypothetical protein
MYHLEGLYILFDLLIPVLSFVIGMAEFAPMMAH